MQRLEKDICKRFIHKMILSLLVSGGHLYGDRSLYILIHLSDGSGLSWLLYPWSLHLCTISSGLQPSLLSYSFHFSAATKKMLPESSRSILMFCLCMVMNVNLTYFSKDDFSSSSTGKTVAVYSLVSSYIMMPAATATFRDSACPRMGSLRFRSASALTSSVTPCPSEPTTSAKPSSPSAAP